MINWQDKEVLVKTSESWVSLSFCSFGVHRMVNPFDDLEETELWALTLILKGD